MAIDLISTVIKLAASDRQMVEKVSEAALGA
jgi:hypothetical protein